MLVGRRFVAWKYPDQVRMADAHAADRNQGYYVPPPAGPPAPKALSRTRRVMYALIDTEAYGYFAFLFGFLFWAKSQPPSNALVFGSTPDWIGRLIILAFAALMVFNFVWILFSLKRRRDRKADL